MNPSTSFASQFLKELRLLRPTWVLAFICSCLPLAGMDSERQMFLVAIGLILLGVRAFGAEFSAGTFLLYLSQPVGRNRLWLVKASAVVVSMSSVIVTGWLLWSSVNAPGQNPFFTGQIQWIWTIALAAAGSGLFFTVLFRQAMIALWMALITPLAGGLALVVAIWRWDPVGSEKIITTLSQPAVLCYGILCGLGSWLLFRSAEDIDRFNSVANKSLGLGSWAKPRIGGIRLVNSPASALLAKEFGLQQINLGLALIVIALHFLAVAAHHWKPASVDESYMKIAVFMSWLLLVTLSPLLIGCVAVAEERRLGAILWHRTLPVSAFKQWLVKIAVVYGLTFLITWLLPICLGMDLHEVDAKGKFGMLMASFGFATAGLLVSSLSKNLLSAFGTAFGLGMALLLFLNLGSNRWLPEVFRTSWLVGLIHLWFLIGGITLLLVIWLLTFRNMRLVTPARRDLFFTAFVVTATVVLTAVLTWMIFVRVWERLVAYPEPQPVVRLHGNVTPKLEGGLAAKIVLLPDGRLISPHLSVATDKSHPHFTAINAPAGSDAETRWRDVASGGVFAYAIRDDGTLWSWGTLWTNPEGKGRFDSAKKIRKEFFSPPTQVGTGADWEKVFASFDNGFALKKDHSLWAWGNNQYHQLCNGSVLPSSVPVRIGSDHDWVQVSAAGPRVFALKDDGSIWEWGTDFAVLPARIRSVPTRLNVSADWEQIQFTQVHAVALKKDHTLWGIPRGDNGFDSAVPYQIGRDNDWKTLSRPVGWQVSILKNDGSLWKTILTSAHSPGRNRQFQEFSVPERIGHSTNWLATGDLTGLGTDGSLIALPYPWCYSALPDNQFFYLAPSRLCPFAINIAQGTKP